jgi:hypothetical protein
VNFFITYSEKHEETSWKYNDSLHYLGGKKVNFFITYHENAEISEVRKNKKDLY